jgi:tRNA threonylcarbamoyladenosine biosynthesis protein TsaB
MKILALDTATELCSASLWIDGALRSESRETAREHAQLILGMIDRLLADGGLRLAALDAIAFGRGPGSFTGVRLAAAVTQGLAFAADLPVLPVSSLRALALQGSELAPGSDHVLCCLDARMGEVYTALYEVAADVPIGAALGEEAVLPPSLVSWPLHKEARVVGIGRGFSAYPALRNLAPPPTSWFALHDRALPRAQEIAILGAVDLQAGRAVPAAQALPVYLRNNVVTQR